MCENSLPTIYGYCRISRKSQKIERQITNIKNAYPEIEDKNIYKEAFTGTKIQGRKELNRLLKKVQAGDTIVFDSVSRMSRNADEGCALYEELYNKGVELVFLKENLCNTSVYREQLRKRVAITTVNTGDKATDTFIKSIVEALNEFQMDLAKEQIRIAFNQAQKEVDDLHDRTRDGLREARAKGKTLGRKQGAKIETKRAKEVKAIIKKYSKDFDGKDSDKGIIQDFKLNRVTYYKCKRELREALINE